MGVEKKLIREGDGTTIPKKNDLVAMEYTVPCTQLLPQTVLLTLGSLGWLFDESKPNNKGAQFDSSVERGDLETLIGVGRVIKGWDEGIQTMSLGEKATLTISSDFAYGAR
ncbi:FKBP-type peptidyl-prolyl isomerase-like protein [Dendryphion nanum]|uniref:peptidylprolyl isomerase n=1 Tax=Dendryphion nanum TaxID=256645 RepID=A0A9P9IIA5_9PLEO|nr:FKBP-type peptidyl-prolyl isomerase-like protein [Dendryphion nanum]